MCSDVSQQYIGAGGSTIYAKPTTSSKKLNQVLQERKALRRKVDRKGDSTPEIQQELSKDGYANSFTHQM